MNNTDVDSWNKTLAECSDLSDDLVSMARLKEISARDVEAASVTAVHRQLASSWLLATMSIVELVSAVKNDAPDDPLFENANKDVEACRDTLLRVQATLLDHSRTEGFESFRCSLAAAMAKLA